MNRDINAEIAQQKKVLADLKKEAKAEQSKAQKARAKKVAEYAKYRHYIQSAEFLFRQVWDFENDCRTHGWNGDHAAEQFGDLSLAQSADAEQLALIYDMLGLTDNERKLYNAYIDAFKAEHADDE